ncbi:transmembrane protein, putative, partial (macronuclear) [Tetrahymena thermophila SB210]
LYIDLEYILFINLIFIIINIFYKFNFQFIQINNFYYRNYHYYSLIFIKAKIFQLFQLNYLFNFYLFIIHFYNLIFFVHFLLLKLPLNKSSLLVLDCFIFNYLSQFKTLKLIQFI